MNRCTLFRYLLAILSGFFPLWSATGVAQNVTGDASAVNATVFSSPGLLGTLTSTTTTLADTGMLAGMNNALDASADTGTVASLVSAEAMSAGTISWPDEVDSVASVGNLNLNVAGISIYADSVSAKASQVLGSDGSTTSIIDNLSLNGLAIPVTGAPNQVVAVPGGQLVLNEQTVSGTGAVVVNALHLIVNGVANVVVASATAGIS